MAALSIDGMQKGTILSEQEDIGLLTKPFHDVEGGA